jgi:hypothetical protein
MFPDRTQNEAQLPATLSADQRRKVLDRVLATLQNRFYAPEKLNGGWQVTVDRHRPLIEGANTPSDFEKEVSDLLKELQASHLGFFHRSARRASERDLPERSNRVWQALDLSRCAYRRRRFRCRYRGRDILLTVDDQNLIPPEPPVLTMGEKISVEVVGAAGHGVTGGAKNRIRGWGWRRGVQTNHRKRWP